MEEPNADKPPGDGSRRPPGLPTRNNGERAASLGLASKLKHSLQSDQLASGSSRRGARETCPTRRSSPREGGIGAPPDSDLGVDPEPPGLPVFTGLWPSATLRLAFPSVAPAFSQIGRQAAPDQGVTALNATNVTDPLSKAHPQTRAPHVPRPRRTTVAIRAWSEASATLEADRRGMNAKPRLRPPTMIQFEATYKGKTNVLGACVHQK